jgi:site-specific recombinase XerD
MLLEALDTRDLRQLRNYVIIALLWSTGLRVGELCNLDWTDLNFRRATMTVRRAKGGKSRMLYLNDRVLADLRAYRKRLPEAAEGNGPVFVALHRTRSYLPACARLTANQVNGMLRRLAAECGLGVEVSPHSLRHTFATHMYEAGCTVEQIKELLGHDDEAETCIYIHISAESARRFLRDERHAGANGE